jgi:protein gp37
MMATSTIEWTQATWNPTTGCNKISPGCKFCYAERMSKRLKAMGLPKYAHEFQVAQHEDTLDMPLRWKNPKLIFVDSMSDLFHEEIPFPFIEKVFTTMRSARWHQFQLLTKRSERLMQLSPSLDWSKNVWMGVSVENRDYTFRVNHLKKCAAVIKFLSLEPLLGPLPELELDGINWVIVGGESGPGARPLREEWVIDIRDQCIGAGIPFFFKQWGGVNKKRSGRLLQGEDWSQLPLPR